MRIGPPIPRPPPRLLPSTRRAWTAFWDSPLGDPSNPVFLPALRRLFKDVDLRDRLARMAESARRSGHPVEDVEAHIPRIETSIRELADQFTLTRLGRLRLAIILGESGLSEIAAAVEDPSAARDLLADLIPIARQIR